MANVYEKTPDYPLVQGGICARMPENVQGCEAIHARVKASTLGTADRDVMVLPEGVVPVGYALAVYRNDVKPGQSVAFTFTGDSGATGIGAITGTVSGDTDGSDSDSDADPGTGTKPGTILAQKLDVSGKLIQYAEGADSMKIVGDDGVVRGDGAKTPVYVTGKVGSAVTDATGDCVVDLVVYVKILPGSKMY